MLVRIRYIINSLKTRMLSISPSSKPRDLFMVTTLAYNKYHLYSNTSIFVTYSELWNYYFVQPQTPLKSTQIRRKIVVCSIQKHLIKRQKHSIKTLLLKPPQKSLKRPKDPWNCNYPTITKFIPNALKIKWLLLLFFTTKH